jgi:hypothetical protein
MTHDIVVVEPLFEIAGGSWLQIAAMCLLPLLLPYFAYRELGRFLGESSLHKMPFTPNPGAATAAE